MFKVKEETGYFGEDKIPEDFFYCNLELIKFEQDKLF
jgi:hypothetical protein